MSVESYLRWRSLTPQAARREKVAHACIWYACASKLWLLILRCLLHFCALQVPFKGSEQDNIRKSSLCVYACSSAQHVCMLHDQSCLCASSVMLDCIVA